MRLKTILWTKQEYVIILSFIRLCYNHLFSNCINNIKLKITSTMVEPMETKVKSEEGEEKKFAPKSN